MEIFGLRLKTLRLAKSLTQKQLAEKLDIGKGAISAYEQNTMYPSIDVLIKICQFFNVSADFLLGLSETKDIKISHLTDEQVEIILKIINQFEQIST